MSNHTIDSLLLGTEPIPDQTSTFITQILQQCAQCTRAAMTLPAPIDYELYMSDPTAVDVHKAVNDTKKTIWGTIADVGAVTSLRISHHTLTNTIRTDEQYSLVKECIGDALEGSNRNVNLINKYKSNDHTMKIHQNNGPQSASFSVPVTLGLSKKMLQRMNERTSHGSIGAAPTKPQIVYNHKIDNSYRPFRPVLRHKPNALTELAESIITGVLAPGETSYPHPYKEEILNLEYTFEQVTPGDIYSPKPLTQTPLYWIDTVEDLLNLEECLKKQTIFAIDLEHHSQHTYQGVTCLVQISTLTQDFIIDALVLREKMSILNSSFTDPTIVKVLHGCNMDVVWLQRDLGLYLVNIFDTAQAARALEFPRYGLATLLQHYCNVKADKSYQLADWRQRPFNREMLVYAREDTHYLLHIYSRMKNDLIDRSHQMVQKMTKTSGILNGTGTGTSDNNNNNQSQSQENIYTKPIVLKINSLGFCSSDITPMKKNETMNTFKVPFLLASVLSQSNRIPLIQYEKANRPVLVARKLFLRYRIGDSNNSNSITNITTPVNSIQKSTNNSKKIINTPQSLLVPEDANTMSNADTSLLDDTTMLRLFCAIYAWRDQKARELDESPSILLKLTTMISIVQRPPATIEELEKMLKPMSIFLRPLVVPLFHLIQGLLQLPSELYSLDINKLKFTIDGLKDLAEYRTSLAAADPLFNSKISLDGYKNGAITAEDIQKNSSNGLHFGGIGTDSTIGLSSNASIQAQRKITHPNSTNTGAVQPTKKDEPTSKKKSSDKKLQKTITAEVVDNATNNTNSSNNITSETPSKDYWSDDTIAQLQHLIQTQYDSIKYSHPLYFIPEYITSLIDSEWVEREGISNNIENNAVELGKKANWGDNLPDFPFERNKISSLNWHAAKRVLEYAHQQRDPNGVPLTKYGLKLFDLDAIVNGDDNITNPEINQFDTDMKDYDAQRKKQAHKDHSSTQIVSLVGLEGENKIGNDNGENLSPLIIDPISSQRLTSHNIQLANDVANEQLGYDQCNQLFTTPIKANVGNANISTANIPLNTNNTNPNAFKLLQLDESLQKLTLNKANSAGNVCDHTKKDLPNAPSSPTATSSTNKTKQSNYNPVAQHVSFVDSNEALELDSPLDFASMISPPRKLGNEASKGHDQTVPNALFTPAHARIGGKLASALVTNLDQSLDWDGDVSMELATRTPHIARAGINNNGKKNDTDKVEKFQLIDDNGKNSTKMGNNSDDSSDDDSNRIPDVKNKGIGQVPDQLHDVYKLSNIKKLKASKVDKDNTNENDNVTTTTTNTDENTSSLNPFAPSRMLMTEQNYKNIINLPDSELFLSRNSLQTNTPSATPASSTSNNNNNNKRNEDGGNVKAKNANKRAQNKANNDDTVSTSAAPAAPVTNPFVVDQSNPFMQSGQRDLKDTQGTVYNPRNLKSDQKGSNKDNNKKKRF